VNGVDAPVRVDAELVRAALVNLLPNAAQAVGERGAVMVRTTIAASAVTVEIHDNGSGSLWRSATACSSLSSPRSRAEGASGCPSPNGAPNFTAVC
jgi:hypothetical protein